MTKSVFVIMPSVDFFQSKERREILQVCAANHGWTTHLPEYDKKLPFFDLHSTKLQLSTSDLVLADLSDERPSCYFELGLAEALNRPIVAFALSGTPIHQTSLRNEICFFDSLDDYRKKVDYRFSRK